MSSMIFCSDLAIECFEKARRSRPLKPLQALKDFRVIYDASGKSDGRGSEKSGGHDRPKFQSPVRRARSLSPVKDSGAAAWRGKTTAVPKSTSMYTAQPGKEKRPPQENAGEKTDAARQVPETTSTNRLRQGRRAKEVGGSVSSDSKDSLRAEETTKTPAQRTMQTDSTRGKTASTSAKPAVNARQSHGSGASKEPQLQKNRASAGADCTDDNPNLPNRGS